MGLEYNGILFNENECKELLKFIYPAYSFSIYSIYVDTLISKGYIFTIKYLCIGNDYFDNYNVYSGTLTSSCTWSLDDYIHYRRNLLLKALI